MRIKNLLRAGLLAIITLMMVHTVYAANLSNHRITVEQPCGAEIQIFISGNPSFSYFHDINGRMIVEDDEGYFVYAKLDSNKRIVPSDNKVTNGLIRTASDNGITIDDIDFEANADLVQAMFIPDVLPPTVPAPNGVGLVRANPLPDEIGNIVILIDLSNTNFQIDPDTGDPLIDDVLENTFNDLDDYLFFLSGGQAEIGTLVATDAQNVPFIYQDNNSRTHYSSDNEATRIQREHTLVTNAVIAAVANSDLVIDVQAAIIAFDNIIPGEIDCVTFIISGLPRENSTLFPHRGRLPDNINVQIAGMRVRNYTIQMERLLTADAEHLGLSQITHNVLNILSFPHLYRRNNDGHPVADWDIMGVDRREAQLPNAHSRLKYGGWGDGFVEITQSGRYVLNARGSRNGITSYAIRTGDPNQFLMLEHLNWSNGSRFDRAFVEQPNFATGLTVSRVNTARFGNFNNQNVRNDEVYVFRPEERVVNEARGRVERASLSSDMQRRGFGTGGGTGVENRFYLQNGNILNNIEISNVSYAGSTVVFDVRIGAAPAPLSVTYINGFNGTLTAIHNGEDFDSGDIVTSGGTVVFEAVPNADFVVDQWFVDGIAQPGEVGEVFALENIQASTTVTVTFRNPGNSLTKPIITVDVDDVRNIMLGSTVQVTITHPDDNVQVFYRIGTDFPLRGEAHTTLYTNPFDVIREDTPANVRIIAYAATDITLPGGTVRKIPSGYAYIDLRFRELSGIDYEGVPQIRVPGVPSDTTNFNADDFFLDLNTQTLTVPNTFTIAAYSINGGTRWTAATNAKFTHAYISRLLRKDLTLVLSDTVGRPPPDTAIRVTFATVNRNTTRLRAAINFALDQDMTGITAGNWVLATNTKANAEILGTGIQIGRAIILPNGKPGKTVDASGFGQFFNRRGIPVFEELINNRQHRETFFIRAAPSHVNGVFTAASQPRRIRARGVSKAPNLRPRSVAARFDNDGFETRAAGRIVTLKRGDFIFGGLIDQITGAPAIIVTDADRDLAAGQLLYIEARRSMVYVGGPFVVWRGATPSKPQSARQIFTES
jgi:M6 family metalloprotease-like protein